MVSSSLFVIIAAIVGFFILRAIAGGYFREPHRATVASAAVALTYLVLSLSHATSDSNPGQMLAEPSEPGATQVGAAAPAPGQNDVSAACRAVHARLSTGAFGSLDAARSGAADIADGETLGAERNLIFAGWAGDRVGRSSARAICLTIDGAIVGVAQSLVGVERPDVAAANHAATLGASGFVVNATASRLPRGAHRFGIAVESADGSWRSLTKTYRFSVT